MKKITIMVPYSTSDEVIENLKKQYEEEGYEVTILGVPG